MCRRWPRPLASRNAGRSATHSKLSPCIMAKAPSRVRGPRRQWTRRASRTSRRCVSFIPARTGSAFWLAMRLMARTTSRHAVGSARGGASVSGSSSATSRRRMLSAHAAGSRGSRSKCSHTSLMTTRWNASWSFSFSSPYGPISLSRRSLTSRYIPHKNKRPMIPCIAATARGPGGDRNKRPELPGVWGTSSKSGNRNVRHQSRPPADRIDSELHVVSSSIRTLPNTEHCRSSSVTPSNNERMV
mmetsp:Transcript_11827/g.25386  ORF Transcript_11827/g.25386 Transcript_11827/m.25386 type:complete len:244 (+) Transcript_11827:436-1167(+)